MAAMRKCELMHAESSKRLRNAKEGMDYQENQFHNLIEQKIFDNWNGIARYICIL